MGSDKGDTLEALCCEDISELICYNSDQGTKEWACVSLFINSVRGFK